ncbi:GntR family transcriptional regulator [Clostridium sp. chh4-2]|uniref:FadR/GntR family transcriptional regulator n=1 Tax=Clostridium sp. chh4-2 TaxID=2067550 RepID=UPI000CCFBF6C|nr:FadR/GntR family transcriptional regulator [Clostridium sp. chh4-2]PNV61187.1 GntR family transcriptional regulator [Clostridium sp. chh4-2]
MDIDFNVKKEALYETVANKLEMAILNDSTQLAQKLPSENLLAQSFGVSRPVIREALMLLQARGLVEQKNGEGNFICEPDPVIIGDIVNRIVKLHDVDISDVLTVRARLETLAGRLAAENINRGQLEKLRNINCQMKENQDNLELRTDLDLEFHILIAQASGNRILQVFVESLAKLLRPIVRKTLEPPNTNEDGIKYHGHIIEALEQHDADKTENLLLGHLVLSARNYESASHMESE